MIVEQVGIDLQLLVTGFDALEAVFLHCPAGSQRFDGREAGMQIGNPDLIVWRAQIQNELRSIRGPGCICDLVTEHSYRLASIDMIDPKSGQVVYTARATHGQLVASRGPG